MKIENKIVARYRDGKIKKGHTVPLLYLRRPGWPEEECLVEWLKENGACAEVPREALEGGDFGEWLLRLLEAPRRPPARATGAMEAEALMAALLQGST